MYLIDHVAELRFVNRLIDAIKRIYTQDHEIMGMTILPQCLSLKVDYSYVLFIN